MESRIVPQAILCIIVTYPVWAFAGWLAAVGILSGGQYLQGLAELAVNLLVPGFIIVGLSIVLLVDRTNRQVWRAVLAVVYGLVSAYSIIIFYAVVSGEGIGSFPVEIGLAAAVAPPRGLLGALWSIAWKPAGEKKKTDNRMWIVTPT